MEKVIAYKSTNGKLFLTEQECVAYENKLAQYPKKKVKEEKSKQTFCFGKWIDVDIVKCTESVWAKPKSQRKDEVYYIVGENYKFIGLMDNLDTQLMNGISIDPQYPSQVDMFHLARYFAERILFGDELTDKYMFNSATLINSSVGFEKFKIEIKVIEANRKWVIDNPSWHYGMCKPINFSIEKL